MIERAKDAFNYDIVYHKFKMAPMDGESLEDLKKDPKEKREITGWFCKC